MNRQPPRHDRRHLVTQHIVLFNGPPRCGKDTAAQACCEALSTTRPCVFDRLSMPIKRAFASAFAVNIDRFGNVEGYEGSKDQPTSVFGFTCRQWQIDFSERFMKPLYGEDIFGQLFIQRASRQHPDALILVPDCGFDIEYRTLAKHFGPENIFVIKLYREDCNFKGDSRRYLKVGSAFPTGLNDDIYEALPYVAHLTNNGTKEDFEHKVLRVVKERLS